MGWGRAVSSLCACGVVAGCAVLAVGMGRAAEKPVSERAAPVTAAPTSRPATPDGTTTSGATPVAVVATPSRVVAASTSAAAPTTSARSSAAAPRPALTTSPVAGRSTHAVTVRPHLTSAPPTKAPSRTTSSRTTAAPPPLQRGGSLPLHSSTYDATKVITVVASHTYSTTARLQAWVKAPGGGWLRSGAQWTAHVGSQGLTTSPSEFTSATPIGSFSLTRAFGRDSDPGTSLPYHKVDSSDYWISHPGPTYNTMQHCTTSGCHTSADEHLIDANPEYNYAAVINYNTTARVYPKGSAFFLHVSDGSATAGCVSVAQSKVVSLLRWMTPSAHPRILIGIG